MHSTDINGFIMLPKRAWLAHLLYMEIFVVTIASFAVAQPALAQACHASDARGQSMVLGLQRIADTAETSNVLVRSKIHTPAVPATQVALVTDDSVCARARQALDSLIHATNPNAANPLPARPLYVIRVGTVTAINDPSGSAGEYSPIAFFDPLWAFLGVVLGY